MSKRKWTKVEIEEYRKMHGSFFYTNKEDSNILVPKAYGIGWTINWGHPISWVFVLLIIGVIVWREVFKWVRFTHAFSGGIAQILVPINSLLKMLEAPNYSPLSKQIELLKLSLFAT